MSEALVSISSTKKKKKKVFKWDEGAGPVSKVLALPAKRPEFNPWILQKKCSTGEAQTDGSLGLTGQTG